jgi:hypothetical protein
MKFPLILIIIVILGIASCVNPNESKKNLRSNSVENLDLEIVRTVVKDDSIQIHGDLEKSFPILDNFEAPIIDSVLLSDSNFNSIFNIDDFNHLKRQANVFKSKKILVPELKSLTKDSINRFIARLDEQNEDINFGLIYYSFSQPLYSSDFKKCILTVNHCCINLMCGDSRTLILIKTTDKWQIVRIMTHWVS